MKKRLIKGKVYCSVFPDHPEWDSLHIYKGESNFKYRLYISPKYTNSDKFNTATWGRICEDRYSYRLATTFEKKWLDRCIEENKYIPSTEIKFEQDYEIY